MASMLFGFLKQTVPKVTGMLNGGFKGQKVFARTYYTDWKMIRDLKRRAVVKEFAPLRLRINCIRKNNILPKAVQEFADQEIQALPRNSNRHRCTNRCVVTSRPRYVFRNWRLSRIVFRHLADYNYLSGAQRAMW